MSIELEIALKYLQKRRRGFFAFVTTLVAIGGITIGVAAMIIILSVMNGFRADIQEKTLGIQPHIVISSLERYDQTQIETLQKRAARVNHVEAVSPFVMGQLLLKSAHNAQGIVVRGIDPQQELNVTNIGPSLVQGRWESLQESEGICPIIIGQELSRSLHLGLGQEVLAISPTESAGLGAMGSVPKVEKFIVSGIFNAGFYEYDASFAFVPLARARKIFGVQAASGLGLRVSDIDQAPLVAREVERAARTYDCLVYPWQALNKNLFKALKLEKIMMSIFLTIIIMIACFTIISNLILMSIEKSRDIGILKALGASRASIRGIFLRAGMILGASGIVLGTALGCGVTWLLGTTRLIQLPQDVYYLDHLPVNFSIVDTLWIVAAAFLITILSAVYPAHQASKTNPIDSIRYG